jgi:histidine triad (HIT) family protein
MLDEEQIKNIKKQIISQIKNWQASEEKKQESVNQIEAMSAEELENFLVKNKLIKTQNLGKAQEQGAQQCPFCLILQGKIPAYKIAEDKKSLAVLEVNPLSRGHTLVLPKEHVGLEKLPSAAFSLAKKVASKLKGKLKSKEVSIQTAEIFGHAAISVIPVYEGKKLEKRQAKEKELKQLQEKLSGKQKKKIRKQIKSKQLEKAPRRIP